MVIGLIDSNGTHFYGYGKTYNAINAPVVNENTIFDIGSITKMFTTTLLTYIVNEGILRIEDPIENHLPSSVKVPMYYGQTITLEDLATHTSGLPENLLIYRLVISQIIQIILVRNFIKHYRMLF